MNKRNEWNPEDCPNWCTAGTDEHPCRGEHRGASVYGYVPATAGYVIEGTPSGSSMDAVEVGLSWPEPWGQGQALTLPIVGGGKDVSVEFKPSEALSFAVSVAEMLDLLVASGSRFLLDQERVVELVDHAEAISACVSVEVSA